MRVLGIVEITLSTLNYQLSTLLELIDSLSETDRLSLSLT
jgi:hypothetical protein